MKDFLSAVVVDITATRNARICSRRVEVMTAITIDDITTIIYTEKGVQCHKIRGRSSPLSGCYSCRLTQEDGGWRYLAKVEFFNGSSHEEKTIENKKLDEADHAAKVLRDYFMPVAEQLGVDIDELGPVSGITIEKIVKGIASFEFPVVDECTDIYLLNGCVDIYSRDDAPWILLKKNITIKHPTWF